MKIAIADKEILQTATNIGVNITPIDEDTSTAKWSLNDDDGKSIVEGENVFDSGQTSEVLDALFTILKITKKPIPKDEPEPIISE